MGVKKKKKKMHCVTCWAWWSHGELALVRDGQRTALGDLYYELATTD